MNTQEQNRFNSLYQQYINELTLQGKRPAPSKAIAWPLRQAATYFDRCPDQLTLSQLKAFFPASRQYAFLEQGQDCPQCPAAVLCAGVTPGMDLGRYH